MTEKHLVLPEHVTPSEGQLVMIEAESGPYETIFITADEYASIKAAREKNVPLTAELTEEQRIIAQRKEAINLLKLPNEYNINILLTTFEKEIRDSIKRHRTNMLKPLTDAKNVLLRLETENMIEEEGRFDFTGANAIPFETACTHCRGIGEIYKFFRSAVEVDCKFCTTEEHESAGTGHLYIPCRVCKGKKEYVPYKKKTAVPCYKCKDGDGNPTGRERVKCLPCRGTAKFKKLVIDAKIKSTTHCHHCKGCGFHLPDPPPKKAKKATAHVKTPDNPVLSTDLAEQIKQASVQE